MIRILRQDPVDQQMRRLFVRALALLLCALALYTPVVQAQSADEKPVNPQPQRWAVILVGLPGDDAHARQFAKTADRWQNWLTESLDFPPQQVLRLPTVLAERDAMAKVVAEQETDAPASTGEIMRLALADLGKKLQPDDTLWVFTLGHGHYDGRRAWWHVAGRDPSDEDFGRWLGGVRCREQVIWLTHSSSGWFVKPLSRAGRIVIAATAADDESNETEFPHALASAMKMPLARLDANADAQVSVAEIFTATLDEVNRLFQNDKRLPTEHAQLDDDGDGRGSENIALKPVATALESTNKVDGLLAQKTIVPYRSKSPAAAPEKPAASPPDTPAAESE